MLALSLGKALNVKRLLSILLISPIVLAGCSNDSNREEDTTQVSDNPTNENTDAKKADNNANPKSVEGDIQSELGKLHGGMCDGDLNHCEVNFTIDDITQLDECDAQKIDERPEGTKLYRVESTVTASSDVDVDPNNEPSDFLWAAQWSTLNADDENYILTANQECISSGMSDFYWGDIRRGDKQTYTVYFNIPEGSHDFRLTVGPNRWFWELPS